MELKSKTKEFKKTLAEKDELLVKCQDATRAVRKELDDHLDYENYVDNEILGNIPLLFSIAICTVSLTYAISYSTKRLACPLGLSSPAKAGKSHRSKYPNAG
jgi:hypothetical protein